MISNTILHQLETPPSASAPAATFSLCCAPPHLNVAQHFVVVTVACGRGGSHTFTVAGVDALLSSNPLIVIDKPLGIEAVEAICRLIRQFKEASPPV